MLSQREQQILERIAAGLRADDPRLADRLANVWGPKARRRRRIGAALIFVAGLAMMTGAVFIPHDIPGGVIAAGVVGYLTMFAAALRWLGAPPI